MVDLINKIHEEKYKFLLIAILLIISILLIALFILVFNYNLIFTHFFYIPIVLSCIWWKRKGLVATIFLAGALIFIPTLLRGNIFIIDTLENSFRALIFTFVGIISAVLSENISKKEKELKIKDNAIESSVNPMLIADLKGNITYVNPSFLKLWGYENNQEVLGKTALDFWQPKEVREVIIGLKEKKGWIGEMITEKKNGLSFNVILSASIIHDKDGKPICIMASVIDVTERKKIEEKLKESEEKFRIISDSAHDAVIQIDNEGQVNYWNKAAEKIFGYKNNEIIGKNLHEILAPKRYHDAHERGFELFKRTGKGAAIDKTLELGGIKKGGVEFPIEISISAVKIREKWNSIAVIRDVTERKKKEALKERFKEELEQEVKIRTKELNNALEQQKLFLDEIVKSSQFKTDFLAKMSHELRTPLNAIIGFTDLLLDGSYGKLNEAQLDFLKDIRSSAKHQFEMIKQILDISKIESGQLKLKISKFSLNDMIDQIISSLKPLYLKKGLKINIKGLESPKEIYADPIRFKEIILNLLDNAIKFTIEGKITIMVQEKREQWVFKIKDTGIGIAEKHFDLIFNDFYRVDSPYIASTSGTGLGLSLIKRLVNVHGGDITFSSVLGVGTTFSFTIPKELKKDINNKDGIK
ncbi:MAG: PAS domain S-box protein [Promethearchaeota archaeon]